jgi:UDP-N-acetylglucosamine:LPS N-acetylglucosamine transferase
VHFVGFHQPPVGPLANFHAVPASEWQGADLMASADAAVAKAGYGTVSEAMASGTPLVFPPRENFAEHAALESALMRWGGGYRVCERQFASLELHEVLEQALSHRPGPPPFPIDGAERIAALLTRELKTGRRASEECGW